jgi:hypothetical protein
MRHPLLVLAAVALAGVAVPALAQAPAPAATAKPGPIKRGADGKPDISGMFMADHGGANYGLERRPATALTPGGRGLIIDPPDGMLPTQPWARAENEARKLPERGYDDPTAHCFVAGVPRSIYAPSPFHILQPPGYVVILHERMSWRQIPLDPSTGSGSPRAQSRRAHLPDAIRLWQGDSVGRWDGDTLVVETANLNGKTWLDELGGVITHQAKVTERFIPVDADTIRYEATVNDPGAYTRPWTIMMPLKRQIGGELLEVACHEDNQDLQHLKDVRDAAREAAKKKP